jgi:hypothetical protein
MALDPKIIEKIQKLINLEEGARSVGSLHEAENAAARLQEFLMKYNLDMETVKAATIEKKAEMDNIVIECDEKQDKRESNWVPTLYIAIANNNLCTIYTNGTKVRIFGHKINVSIVAYIAEQMIAKIRIAEKMSWASYEKANPDGEKRGTFRRGFFKGAGIGIGVRLRQQRRDMMQDTNPYAVMIVHKEQEVRGYIDEFYGIKRMT